MFGVRHEIIQEFPEFESVISRLKNNDPTFTRLLADYDHADKKIYGIEQQMLPVADNYVHELKRQRLRLKDRLYQFLRETSAA